MSNAQEIQDRDQAATARRLHLAASAVVRFLSAEPGDTGPRLRHWPAHVARVVLEDVDDLNGPPIGYYELHAGGSVAINLEELATSAVVLKVLAGTVEVLGASVGRLLVERGDTCTITARQVEPKANGLEPLQTTAAVDESDMVTCYRCQMRLPSRLTRDSIAPRGGLDRVCAACDHFDLEKRAEVIALRRARNAAPTTLEELGSQLLNTVGEAADRIEASVRAGLEAVTPGQYGTAEQRSNLAGTVGDQVREHLVERLNLAPELAAYTATIRSLTERLAQAEQTRDAAQAEATRQTDLARRADQDHANAARLAAGFSTELFGLRGELERLRRQTAEAADELRAARLRSAELARTIETLEARLTSGPSQ